MGLLDGTDRAPAETMETEDENKNKISMENPAYATWIARDQQVLHFLLNSLSLDILSHVIGVVDQRQHVQDCCPLQGPTPS
jgi:hypothetical protein